MSKQRRIWIAVAVVAAVLLPALLLFQRNPGPRYQGRTVAQWLDNGLTYHSVISADAEAATVLTAFGSNAIPALLEIINDGYSWRLGLTSVIGRQGWVPATLRAKYQASFKASALRTCKALYALGFIGDKAKPALTELERIASRPNHHISPSAVLNAFSAVAVRSETFPAVIRIATNAPAMYRPSVDVWLRGLLYRSYTELGLQAALAQCELGSPPPEVIPPLAQCINSPRSPHRRYALQALAKLAPQYAAARDAVRDAVLEASESDDPAFRDLARAILEQQMAGEPSKTK